MTITHIKNNVQALLEETGRFRNVIAGPQDGEVVFTGYPSASHYYESTENNYATVSQNRRVIVYVIQMYVVTNEDIETEFDEAYDLMDEIIQMLDETIDLSEGLGNSTDPVLTRACDIMRPVPGEFRRVPTNLGDGLELTIRLYCEADVAFR